MEHPTTAGIRRPKIEHPVSTGRPEGMYARIPMPRQPDGLPQTHCSLTTQQNGVPTHPATTGAIAQEYLSAQDLAVWLHVPRKTIYGWKARRQLPFTKIVGKVRFRKADIEAMLARGSVDAIDYH